MNGKTAHTSQVAVLKKKIDITEAEDIANSLNQFFSTIGQSLASVIPSTDGSISVDTVEHSMYLFE